MGVRGMVSSWKVAQRPVVMGMISSGLAAVCYGSSQFLARKLVTEEAPPFVVATYALLTGMVILGVVTHRGIIKDRRAPRRAFLMMVLAGLATTAGVTFNLLALSRAPVVIVAPVSSITPLVSLALAHIFLQRLERVTPRIWLGAALVVAGVGIIAVGSA
jgi:drug/metabolite transporter (DMT)-like permease